MLRCDISKQLPGFRLEVRLEAGRGVLALFGPSGSGKSLTLQCLAGLVRPDTGLIEVGGRPVFAADRGVDLPPQRRQVGYVFQNYALFPHLTVKENVAYGLHRLPRPQREARVAEALAAMRLAGLQNRRPAELSGGQQQRVALARALVTRPKLLLLDEPFAALDSIIRGRLHRELLELLDEAPVTTLLVTHSLDEAYALSREIAVFEAGRVLQHGPRDEVFYHPSCKSVARFMGMKNFIPGLVAAVTEQYTRVDGPGFTLWGPPAACRPGQAVECCIRPEHVLLVRKDRAGEGPGPLEARLDGVIVQEVTYGGYVQLLWRAAGPAHPDMPDLHVTLPTHVYRRLGVAGQARWSVALKADFIHLLPAEPDRTEWTRAGAD